MANHSSCGNCGNSEEGTQIMQCKNCGRIGCYTSKGFFGRAEGCWTDKPCPHCGKSDGYKIIRKI